MRINKIKNYKSGIRASDSVIENLKDLMLMVSKQGVNLEAESKKMQEQNKLIGDAGNLVYHCVETIIKDNTVNHISCYLKPAEFTAVKPMILQYSRIVKVNVSKSKSIKDGFDLTFRRLEDET